MKRFLLALGLVIGLSLVTAASASAADYYRGGHQGHGYGGYPGQYQGYARNNAYYHNGHVHHNGHIHPAPVYRPPVYCPPTYYPQQPVYGGYYPSQNYIGVQGPRFRVQLGF